MKLNERLRDARIAKGKTLKEVAIDKRTTQQSLIQYEKGTISPRVEVLKELCEYYGVSLNYIVYGNENGIKLEYPIQKQMEVFAVLRSKELAFYDANINATIIKSDDINKYMKFLDYYFELKTNKNDSEVLNAIITFINNMQE